MSKQHKILLETGTNELELIEFGLQYIDIDGHIATQHFGINVTKVREIIRFQELTTLPEMDSTIRGMINLRDQLIPVLDLRYWLYRDKATGEADRMIVAEFNGIRVGFMVNAVTRIHRISWKHVFPPSAITDVDPAHSTIVGLTTIEDRMILIIDVEEIVASMDPSMAMTNVELEHDMFGSAYTVLMAEDSSVIRQMLYDKLKLVGFNIISVGDGQQAWNLLQTFAAKTREGTPLDSLVDLIITDIEMPQMDGYTLIKNIKEHDVLGTLPVIIFSSMVSEDNKHKGISVGADAQLTKPQIIHLVDTAKSLLPDKTLQEAPEAV